MDFISFNFDLSNVICCLSSSDIRFNLILFFFFLSFLMFGRFSFLTLGSNSSAILSSLNNFFRSSRFMSPIESFGRDSMTHNNAQTTIKIFILDNFFSRVLSTTKTMGWLSEADDNVKAYMSNLTGLIVCDISVADNLAIKILYISIIIHTINDKKNYFWNLCFLLLIFDT